VARVGWALLAGAAVALPLSTGNTYYLYLACSALLLTIVTAGLNVLAGLTGQISLGHAGFYALGAYGAALAATRLGWPSWLAASAGVVVAAAVGALVAAAALRVSGPYLAMVTIAFGIIVESVLVEWVSVTGGPGGIFNIPKLPLGRYYWVIAASAAVALWLAANLRRSAWGRAFLAVKGSEVAAESLGLSAYYVRIVAFTVSAAFTGAAGALFSGLTGYISPDSFTLQTSILFLLALLFGGMGSVAGPVVGSLALTVLPELLTGLSDYRLILYGSLLLVSMYWLPSGLIGALTRGPARGLATGSSPRETPPWSWASNEARNQHAPLLGAAGISLSFGGVLALADLTLSFDARGIHAVIGPNGAGKTSLLNVLAGFYDPDTGAITLAGLPIAGLPPYRIARLGVARTFQTAQLFGDLTVRENVAVGLAGEHLGSVGAALLGTPRTRRAEDARMRDADSLLAAMGLVELADRPADSLPAGLRRRVEIARALARRPEILMLDEPAAGLSPVEIEDLDAELRALSDGGGPAIILVEHHMDLVMAVSDRISVLDHGRVIASGSPESVRENPRVIEAYLGAGT
jgi:ABC-type branched-subunit amino acid transport system ATPase component/ABC-type branched-subunit amino acid transport system permease subunit